MVVVFVVVVVVVVYCNCCCCCCVCVLFLFVCFVCFSVLFSPFQIHSKDSTEQVNIENGQWLGGIKAVCSAVWLSINTINKDAWYECCMFRGVADYKHYQQLCLVHGMKAVCSTV